MRVTEMDGFEDLGSLLRASFDVHRGKKFVFPAAGRSVSYEEMLAQSDALARGLRKNGISEGDTVGLLFATTPEFIAAFIGVVSIGATVVPLPHPGGARAFNSYVQRLTRIVESSGMRIVLVGDEFFVYVSPLLESSGIREVRAVRAEMLIEQGGASADQRFGAHSSDLALVQYTSGSTAEPKGVALTHRNVLAGIRAIISGIELTEHDVNGQWLPLHHDMGLIGMLSGIVAGVDHYLWSPAVFIRRPGPWLLEFSKCGATIYAGPNFSYATLLRKTTDDLLKQLDLGRWRIAFNGAEVIDPTVVERFMDRFGKVGFRPSTMFPVYGLAEATLAVTFPALGEVPRVSWVDRAALADGRVSGRADATPADARVELGRPDGSGTRGVVGVGTPVLGHEVRIVDSHGNAVEMTQTGAIEVRGPAVMDHYLGMSPEASGVSDGGWVKTGDIGFMHEGRLHVTGRSKEMIIVRGSKYYPFDVEAVAREVPGVYRDHVIAFAYADEQDERIVIMAETENGSGTAREFEASVREAVVEELGLSAVDIVSMKPRTLARTTSGKFQRLLMRERLRAGELNDCRWS